MRNDLYQLMVMVEGQEWVKTFPVETQEEAEQRGKRMVKKKRKNGVEMKALAVRSSEVINTLQQALRAGKI